MNSDYNDADLLDEVSLGDSCYVDDQDVQLDKLTCRYTQKDNMRSITRKFAFRFGKARIIFEMKHSGRPGYIGFRSTFV